jgi:hypothetical protein
LGVAAGALFVIAAVGRFVEEDSSANIVSAQASPAPAVNTANAMNANLAQSANATQVAVSTNNGANGAAHFPDTGCKNWRGVSVGPSTIKKTADECVDQCRLTPGCHSVNYQTDSCPHKPNEQVAQGSCYLFGADCDRGPNDCWDLYRLPKHERMEIGSGFEDPQSVKYRTYCSNMKEITRGVPATHEWSIYGCKVKCQLNQECTGIVYQPGECTSEHSLKRNYCFLIFGTCAEIPGHCWDVHPKQSPTPAPAPAPVPTPPPPQWNGHLSPALNDCSSSMLMAATAAGATTFTVQDFACFDPGDTVTICSNSSTDQAVVLKRGTSGSYELASQLKFPHQPGALVVKAPNDCASILYTQSTTTAAAATTTEESTPAPTAHPQHKGFLLAKDAMSGSRDIFVLKEHCFMRGDIIQLVNVNVVPPEAEYTIVDMGSLRLDKPITQNYTTAKTHITRRIPAGVNSKNTPLHCGSWLQ